MKTKRPRTSNTPPVEVSTQLSSSNSAADESTQEINMEQQLGDELPFGLRFENARHVEGRDKENCSHEEDLRKLLQELASVSDSDQAKKSILQPLPEAYRTEEAIRQSVCQELERIHADDRSHRDVAADVSFDMRHCLPKPWFLALRAFAAANGMHLESLVWCLYANLAFLEHPSRRIGAIPGGYTESVNIPVFVGGSASTRRSFLLSTTNDFMIHNQHAPKTFQQRQCIVADGTVAELRRCLSLYGRATVTCDAVSYTHLTLPTNTVTCVGRGGPGEER